MGQRIKYVIFETEWGYFGLAGIEGGLYRSALPVKDERKAKSLLLKGLDGERCQYSKDYLKGLQNDVSAYYKGGYVNFKVRIFHEGLTEFQAAVLKACRKIKYGQIRSYGELAQAAGRKSAVRAVGGVLSRNCCPLIIPCHRVTYSDGKTGGFSAFGGVKVKERMLEMESKRCGSVRIGQDR
ncbi:MAG: methylated-DNA--[protein]-cysteine S-methyltransferase [Planctomycetota bacterium]|jgi:methylated-DNA-[protein]-cysteine S-methyltransferase